MSLIVAIIIGIITGLVTGFVLKGRWSLLSAVLGIFGAVIGTGLSLLGGQDAASYITATGLLFQIIGAMIVVFIASLLQKLFSDRISTHEHIGHSK